MNFSNIDVKSVWINHDEDLEYTRVTNRGAERDEYKLEHWEEYAKSLSGIEPDSKYNAYCYNNDDGKVIHLSDEQKKWLEDNYENFPTDKQRSVDNLIDHNYW